MFLNCLRRSFSVVMLGTMGGCVLALSDPQIRIETPKGSQNLLAVYFQNLKAAGIELVIDEVPVAYRALPKWSSGSLSFPLDATRIAPGYHQVKVNFYDAQGHLIGTAHQQIEIQPDPAAPVTILTPRYGTTVAGVVEIEVQVANAHERPYVSIFVDRQFRTLRNFAPYLYTWDTTREQNGWHLIEALVVEESREAVKAPPVRVFVNNPGGRTERRQEGQETVAALTSAPPLPAGEESPVRKVEAGSATMAEVAHLQSPSVASHRLASKPQRTLSHAPSTGQLPVHSPTQPFALRNHPVSQAQVARLPRLKVPTSAARRSPLGAARIKSTGSLSAPSTPPRGGTPPARSKPVILARFIGQKLDIPALPPLTSAKPATGSPQPSVSRITKPDLVQPAAPALKASVPRIAAPALAKPATPPLARRAWVPITVGTRLPRSVQTFGVVFDSTRLTFDVQPRVQAGIPLAPFRHLFEYVGGQLQWQGETHTVVAQGMGRSLQFQIGNPVATVNGSKVQMEVAPLLISGRSLVPCSFLQEVLNVEVFYDPTTGNLIMNSK